MADSKSSGKSGTGGVGKLLRDQVLLKVGEQLLNSETVREVVKNEVLRSVERASGKMTQTPPSTKNPSNKSPSSPADLTRQVSEVWQHPVVQQAVKGGVKSATERAQQWREQVRTRADERQDEQLLRRQQRGETLSPQEAVELAQRRAARERLERQKQARARIVQQAQTPAQRQVLELVFQHTPWLSAQTTSPLRYIQLLDTLAPTGQAEQEMKIHRALWSLAEARVLLVSPHGDIQLVPEPDDSETSSGY